MLVKTAKLSGNVSKGNTKMPGSTFALDAFACQVGSKLAKIEGSVCNKCYARRLQTIRPSVDQGWKSNQTKFEEAAKTPEGREQWQQAIAFQILRMPYVEHRWFDSGDLFSTAALDMIVQVCLMTPNKRHWLPTREAKIVKDWLKANSQGFPANLVVRLSSTMIGDIPRNFPWTSTVHRKGEDHYGHACPALSQGNSCGPCRACWDPTVKNVSYVAH